MIDGKSKKELGERVEITITFRPERPLHSDGRWGTVEEWLKLANEALDEYGMEIISRHENEGKQND